MLLLVLTSVLMSLVTANTLVSIDMGTEFMKVGLVKQGVPIDIVLNSESKRKTPMVVYIKGDERLFGDSALTRGMKSPKNAYAHLLDLLGKSVDNPVVEEYKTRFPYHTIEADPVRGTVVFRHDDNTFYTVEELLAMQLHHAVQAAVAHGGAAVSKVIICVPPFFNQVERTAMLNVADIAGVEVIQMMNTNAAVALQYAVFRNIKMTEKPMIVMFANVGSQFTTATVVSFSLQKDKASGSSAKIPTVQIMGTGYDRSLGGFEMDIRLRDHLAAEFTAKYPKLSDIKKNQRAMQKLLKEAKKVKTVLSANAETFAQVETLHEDKDFRIKVTRESLEEFYKDLYPRFDTPFEEAISTAGIAKSEIEQVVLFGAGTRVPKIQDQLLKVNEVKVLHKYINTDEAAAMGSAFMAASISSVFRTKQIKLKDGNPFPFHVSFFKNTINDQGEITDKKWINKELYYRNNGIPQKKAMTYTKFTDDFHFNISYGNLAFLTEKQLNEFGYLPLMYVEVKGVQDVFNQHHDKASKGIKAHMAVDESGMIKVDSVEAIFETIVVNKTESGWMDSVSNFFSGTPEDEKKEESETKGEQKTKDEKNKTETKNETVANKTTTANKTMSAEPEKPKIFKEKLTVEVTHFGIPQLTDKTQSKDKLAALQKIDDDKRATEESRNKLESYIINMKDLMSSSDVYQAASTEEEQEKINKALSEETDWLEEDSWGETFAVFNARLAKIEDYCDPIINRVKEFEGRSAAIADLKQAFNLTEMFLAKMANTSEELRYHTVVEIDNLEKKMNDTKTWLDKSLADQDKLAKNVDPTLKLTDINAKRTDLERELYYLVRKPIPQWYKEKLQKMKDDLLKSMLANATKNATKEDNKVTDSDLEDENVIKTTPLEGDKTSEDAKTPEDSKTPDDSKPVEESGSSDESKPADETKKPEDLKSEEKEDQREEL